jgi:hypothetical protein
MLFDDDEQLEVRHVISLAHHEVSIYSGGDETPEGELFIKRNALCLSRRTDVGEITPDGRASKPFYLFSENCSMKEDFYFTLLRNQERKPGEKYQPPIPLQYDVKDIITLVQRLHSSEEHLQTRWINAAIGRVFLALYKTSEVSNFIKSKITKKISRVKRPSFLSNISLRNIDMGEAAPVITNPRLKDLTVDGELVVEADVKYSGNFRLEVAAVARIDLGTRFKAREVNLLLAVVVKRVEGHAMIRIKPPPSNRLWLSFQTMPKIDMTIEPIVSARQITYTLILRQIENRIKEVIAESLVFPNWDDSPFYHTENKPWRGGIWADDHAKARPEDPEIAAAQDGDVDEVAHLEATEESDEADMAVPEMEKSMSTPLTDASPPNTAYARKGAKSVMNLGLNLDQSKSSGSSTSVESRPSEKPRALRSGSFAATSSPLVSTDVTNADAIKPSNSTPPEHSHAMAAVSALSQSNTPVGSPSRTSRIDKAGSQSSVSSREPEQSEKDTQNELTPQPSISVSSSNHFPNSSSYPPSPSSMSNASLKSEAPSSRSFGSLGRDPRRENSTSTTSSGKSTAAETKRLSLAAVSNAAATAKKWGWNAIQRHSDQKPDGPSEDPPRPLVMGRGQPLPPPGTPLPPPDKKTKTAPIPMPKRKPIPPPNMPVKKKDAGYESNGAHLQRHPVPPPPLPKRPSREESKEDANTGEDGIFVVEAPVGDSEPTTPLTEHVPTYIQPWVDDVDEAEEVEAPHLPPALPKRRPAHRVLSSSPEEDGPSLPSWVTAQEEEARAKSSFVDEDAGL